MNSTNRGPQRSPRVAIQVENRSNLRARRRQLRGGVQTLTVQDQDGTINTLTDGDD